MRHWRLTLLLACALATGAALRFVNASDMEYKEDEEINYVQSQKIIADWPRLPAVGMPSGVYIPNPGLSVWMFAGTASLTGARTPVEVAHAVQGVALAGICLILPFAFFFARPGRERELWLWAFALALVNPFLIVYHRKLWPQPFLPIFCLPMLMGYWRRETRAGALVWGLFGALLGQVHMAGFFVAGGLALWTALFRRKGVRGGAWLVGSVLGTLPLLPWLKLALTTPRGGSITALSEPLQLKYWVFWLSDAIGLHLGNPLGLSRGGAWAQISDFIRYPLWDGHPTYLVGVAHAVLAATALTLVGCVAARAWRVRGSLGWRVYRSSPRLVRGVSALVARVRGDEGSTTRFVGVAYWLGAGALLTATCVNIRRYYLCATFPFEGIALAGLAFVAFADPRRARAALATVWVAQAIVSAGFVYYVHVNNGAPQGDYGDAYHVVAARRGAR